MGSEQILDSESDTLHTKQQVFDSTDRLVVYEVQHLARISPGPMLSKTLADESQGEWSSAISPPYPAATTCHDKSVGGHSMHSN